MRGWCRECGREVDMVGLKEAVALTGATQPMLAEYPGNAGWHWSQTEDGSPLLCLESLLKSRGDAGEDGAHDSSRWQ